MPKSAPKIRTYVPPKLAHIGASLYDEDLDKEIDALDTTWHDEDDVQQDFDGEEPAEEEHPRKRKKAKPKAEAPPPTEEELEDERELEELRCSLLENKPIKPPPQPSPKISEPPEKKPKLFAKLMQAKREAREIAKQQRKIEETRKKERQNGDDEVNEAMLFGEGSGEDAPGSPSLQWES